MGGRAGAPESGSGHAAVQDCRCFPRIKFPLFFQFQLLAFILGWVWCCPIRAGGCTPSFPGVQPPLQWARGTFWGVRGGGVSAATLPSPAQPGGNRLCHKKSRPLPAVSISGLGFSQWIWLLQEQRMERGAWGSLCTHPLGQHKAFISRLECFFFPKKTPDPSHDAGAGKARLPAGAQGRWRGKALSPSTCYLIFNPGAN